MAKMILNGIEYAGIEINDTQPIGEIIDSGSDTAPLGYLPCDGRSLLRSEYPELFKAIGTKYGAVDAQHFNLPKAVIPFDGNLSAGEGIIFTRTDGQKDGLRADEGILKFDQQLGSASQRSWKVMTNKDTFENGYDRNGNGEISGTLAYIEGKIMDKNTQDGRGSFGSFNLTTAVSSMGAGWYNYIYIPHRTGLQGGDNYKYGTMLCFPMTTNSSSIVIIHNIGATWQTPIVK